MNETSLSCMMLLAQHSIKLGNETKILLSGVLNIISDIPVIKLNNWKKNTNSEFLNRCFLCIKIILFKILPNSITNILNKIIWINDFQKKKKEISSLFMHCKPDVVYVYGDRHGGYEPALLSVCQKHNIKTIIPPISFISNKENLIKSVKRNNILKKQYVITNDSKFKLKYPNQWVHDKISNQDVLFYPKWMVEVMDKYQVLSSNPWSFGFGNSSHLQVEGLLSYNRLVNEGLDKKKISVTGHPEHDNLYFSFKNREKYKKKIKEKYNLCSNRIVIISLPQMWEHNILTKKGHFILINEICDVSNYIDCDILISLHPKMKKENYLFLEQKYNVKIIDEKLCDILPIAELYIVGQGSSTVPWAVLCEIPVVICDWYGLNYTYWNWIKGKILIKDVSKFVQVVSNLIIDKELLNQLIAHHKKQKCLLSPFDGNSLANVLNV